MQNILILSAGRRVDLCDSFLEQINLKGYDIKLFTSDLNPDHSSACQKVENFFTTPHVNDPNYIDYLLNKSNEHNIGMILPTIDTELLILSKNISLFQSNKINLIVSNQEFIKVCNDKRLTANFFDNLNLQTPKIYKKEELNFPCFAKPISGSSGIGSLKLEKKDDLSNSVYNNDDIIFTEYIGEGFKEYTIDMYYNCNGILKCLVPRERIEVRAGEISKGTTRKNYLYDFLLLNFKSLPGARGCITLQLFYNLRTSEIYFIEINPRFGGGFPLSYSAGANFPGWLLEEYFIGREISFFDKWQKDLLMLRYDSKILKHDVIET